MCGASRQAQKSHFPFLLKIRGDEMGVVGLDKGDLGWGRSGDGGGGGGGLDESCEPGLETVQRLGLRDLLRQSIPLRDGPREE